MVKSLIKTCVIIMVNIFGVSCTLHQSIDCAKDLHCEQFTKALIEAYKLQSLDAQSIKKITKTNGFKYHYKHMLGKPAPYNILELPLFFDERSGRFLTKESTKESRDWPVALYADYRGGVKYYSINGNGEAVESLSPSAALDPTRNPFNILFVISEVGQIAIDYKHRSVTLYTSSFWDVKKNKRLFKQGERVLKK